MAVWKCTKAELAAALSGIAEKMPLYLPVEKTAGVTAYKRYAEGDVYSDAIRGARSPKELFFPQTEDLVKFKTEGKKIEIIDPRTPGEDFAVFGVHGCDLQALKVLDRVFLSDPADSYYADRRKHGILVTMSCAKPTETCFCGSFGVDPSSPDGDVRCTATSDGYLWETLTEKGESLLSGIPALSPAGEDAEKEGKEAKEKIRARMQRLPLASLSTAPFGKGKTETYFDDPCWETLSRSCIGCGSCTFVCPTCQCYDIRDFETGSGVVRYRCWDSCMYSDFTLMSAGQPRHTQKERFRQRFMHKLVYFPDNNDGMFSCVGCGRCLQKCPQALHIVKVMKALAANGKGGKDSE